MMGDRSSWELRILDAAPPATSLGALAVGDIDQDGRTEIVTCGKGALLWYRPATVERGIIAKGDYHVGVALEDLDGDGRLEIVVGERLKPGTDREEWMICWYKASADLTGPWNRHVLDPHTTGGPHDLVFADLNGDGTKELIATAMYCDVPGLFVYRPGSDISQPWERHAVQTGLAGDGTAAADLDGDGLPEIVAGPYLYHAPSGGPFAGPWHRSDLALGFREMCRTAILDITGNGRPDVIIAEAEYPDGKLSWFENRDSVHTGDAWEEHLRECPVNFAHTLSAWRDRATGEPHVFVAEMAQGGWNPPYNWDARLIQFSTSDGGDTWERELVYRGAGTHEGTAVDVDGDGDVEFVGKECYRPRIQIWKRRETPSPFHFRHRFVDREKPCTGTDILATDIDGDGLADVACARWWYHNPGWERREIPGIYQVLNAYDLDGDGHQELLAMDEAQSGLDRWYDGLSSRLCWLKPVDPLKGKWEKHPIGTGSGDWPHGTVIAPLLPGGRLALVTGYHNASCGSLPEIWEIPDDPAQGPWPKRVIADIPYGEEMVVLDVDEDGKLDLIAGQYWLEAVGDGTFRQHEYAQGYEAARVRVGDVAGEGRAGIVMVEEGLTYREREAYFRRIAWFERPANPCNCPWPSHVIDTVRSPHSVDVADLDGDGQLEVIVGEHDPFKPYRARNRLLAYKKADAWGLSWYRHVLDEGYEHHCGTKVFEVAPGRSGIISHAWAEPRYVHLWEAY